MKAGKPVSGRRKLGPEKWLARWGSAGLWSLDNWLRSSSASPSRNISGGPGTGLLRVEVLGQTTETRSERNQTDTWGGWSSQEWHPWVWDGHGDLQRDLGSENQPGWCSRAGGAGRWTLTKGKGQREFMKEGRGETKRPRHKNYSVSHLSVSCSDLDSGLTWREGQF